ncbi:hypothetical protein H4R20_000430 [Coemansia guatemalensis]|uniref:CsbD-like domain-containing protein n=1 Tax=Coemansia guatemalensis TaxID=2761395 RepID=A0A9W8I5A6_9FUNG|nr:hypothetical protein H4R20_000430 [Coemansia guatemalensis]
MSNFINQATGYVKETVGNLTGNEDMKVSGHVQYVRAIGEREIEKSRKEQQKSSDNANNDTFMKRNQESMKVTGGAAQEYFGKLTGNSERERSGHNMRAQTLGEKKLNEKRPKQSQKIQ